MKEIIVIVHDIDSTIREPELATVIERDWADIKPCIGDRIELDNGEVFNITSRLIRYSQQTVLYDVQPEF